MNKFTKALIIIIFILINLNCMHAQTTQSNLDQVELMKKFIGTWKGEFGDNSIFFSENEAFGSGMISKSKVIVNGEIIESVAQIHGYDSKADKFIIAELKTSSEVIEICSSWFTSENTGEIIITNPDKAPYRFKFEFKNPNLILQTAIQGDKVVNEILLKRSEIEK
ncbi:MAG: hypothetical protein KKG99_10945 [Bacteroidetes bacterium]|nr:hypothetical protein [Bacteroidota bacterium]